MGSPDSKESMAPGRALCAFALLVARASAVQSEMSAEAEMFAEEENAVIVKYSKIPGFALKEALLNGPSGTTGGDAKACEQRCTSAGKACKSYSYSAAKKLCFVSKETLMADPNFVLKSKAEASQSGKEWRTFEGMTYTPDGWTKVMGVSLAGCEAKCKENTGCGMLSYRKVDEMCLMSPKRLDYAPGFDCYEKSNAEQGTIKVTRDPDSTVLKPADEKPKEEKEQAEVKELAAAEQAKITASDQQISAAKAIEKKAADELAAAKAEEKKEIADAKASAAAKPKKPNRCPRRSRKRSGPWLPNYSKKRQPKCRQKLQLQLHKIRRMRQHRSNRSKKRRHRLRHRQPRLPPLVWKRQP